MLIKQITMFGAPVALVCDGQCNKAWGISARPAKQLSADEDDFVFLSDDELGEAPADPGSYEGGHGKPSAEPLTDPERMNKWCARACERSSRVKPGAPLITRDLKNPTPNIPRKS